MMNMTRATHGSMV